MTESPEAHPLAPIEKIRSALTGYRVMAWLTGIWLIALCYELILKYVVKVEYPPEWISIVHGWVYFVYLLFTANLAVKVKPAAKAVVTAIAVIVQNAQSELSVALNAPEHPATQRKKS